MIFDLIEIGINDFPSNMLVLLVWVETFRQCVCRRLVGGSHMSQNVISGKMTTFKERKFLEVVEIVRFIPINYILMDVKAF